MAFPRFQIGCMTDFKVADDTLPIADSPLYQATIWILKCTYIRVFRVAILGIFPTKDFWRLLVGPLFY
jgi:hypothetical protein